MEDEELAKRILEVLELGKVLSTAELETECARELPARTTRAGRDDRSEVSACRARREDEAILLDVSVSLVLFCLNSIGLVETSQIPDGRCAVRCFLGGTQGVQNVETDSNNRRRANKQFNISESSGAARSSSLSVDEPFMCSERSFIRSS